MKYILPFLFLAVACTDANETLVREDLTKKMNLEKGNLSIEKVELGEKVVATPAEKQDLALMGMKDSVRHPLKVTFSAKEDCVAIAEAIQNDVIFNEKKVSCRPLGKDGKPNLKYVKNYNFGAFGRRIAVYEEGKLIKKGETFVAVGVLLDMTTSTDEHKKGTLFKGLE